ncbi:MAG: rod shape-determining protein MreD [Actinobacteria bacterium]|nr:rod shape-determining protein MreD [Actinomycetota bacterium]
MVRRTLAIVAIMVTALLLQSTVFSQIRLLGAKPELMYLLVIVLAIIEGPADGAGVGFAGGMAQDFFLNQPKGITALTLTLLGYTVGLARQYIVSPSPLLPSMMVAGATLAGVLFYETVAFLLGTLQVDPLFFLRIAVFSALYTALLTPLVYPLLRRVFEGSRRRRVVRF